jgi:hypothetical protein
MICPTGKAEYFSREGWTEGGQKTRKQNAKRLSDVTRLLLRVSYRNARRHAGFMVEYRRLQIAA